MAKSGGDWGIVGVSLVSPDPARPPRPAGLRLHRPRARPRRRDPAGRSTSSRTCSSPARTRRPSSPPWPTRASASSASPSPRRATATSPPPAGSTATTPTSSTTSPTRTRRARPRASSSRALARRRAAGPAPFTVLCCDNLPENGRVVRGVTLELARLRRPRPRRLDRGGGRASPPPWSTASSRPPSPRTSSASPRSPAVLDLSPVMHEPFRQWVVEDRLRRRRPPRPRRRRRPARRGRHPLRADEAPAASTAPTRRSPTSATSPATRPSPTPSPTPPSPAFVRHLWTRRDHPDPRPAAGRGPRRLRRRPLRSATPTRRSATAPGRSPWTAARSCRSASSAPSPTTAPPRRPCPGLTLAVAAWMRYVGGVDETRRGRSTSATRWPRASRRCRDAARDAGRQGRGAARRSRRSSRRRWPPTRASAPTLTAAAGPLAAEGARAAVSRFGA